MSFSYDNGYPIQILTKVIVSYSRVNWSGSDSLVPAYQKQIDYLRTLYALVPGVKYLKHKSFIRSKIERMQEMIKKEELEVICRNLYM